jgi:hypothetical protein
VLLIAPALLSAVLVSSAMGQGIETGTRDISGLPSSTNPGSYGAGFYGSGITGQGSYGPGSYGAGFYGPGVGASTGPPTPFNTFSAGGAAAGTPSAGPSVRAR